MSSLAGGRFITVARSVLSRLLFAAPSAETEVMFGDQIAAIQDERTEGPRRVRASPCPASFDLVIGADGLHSNVRKLVFGPELSFEKNLGYAVAAFEAEGYRPRDEDVYVHPQ